MKKVLAILLLPLLLALPTSGAFFANQNCEIAPIHQEASCYCDLEPSQIIVPDKNSCCCEMPSQSDKEVIALISDFKLIEFDFANIFEFYQPFELRKKLNIIEDYSKHYSAGFSTSEVIVLNSPPIYRQLCTLRI